MLQNFRNDKGFSIVQVMVGIGLAGVLALVVMKISQNMSTVQNEAESSSEENELKIQLRMILDNSDHCSVSLAGLNPATNPVRFKKRDIDAVGSEGMTVELYQAQKNALGQVVGRTKRFTSNASDTTPTLVRPKKIKIMSMVLNMPNPPANTNYPQATKHSDIGSLVLMIEKNKRSKRLELPLVVTMSTNSTGDSTILQCRSQPTVDPCPPLGLVLDSNTGNCRPQKQIAAGYAQPGSYQGIWGGWGSWDMCTGDRLVCGIQSRIEGSQGGGDDTGLNAVRLICCNSLPIGRLNEQDIFSKQSGWGDWREVQYCPTGSYVVGINLKLEGGQGGGDDTAANAVNLRCNDPGNTILYSGHNVGWGNWRGFGFCPAGQIACGMQTRVEDGQGGGDDTALNGIQLRCCRPNE